MINLKTFAIFCSTFSLSLGFSANFNANECRLELDAFSALSKSYGQQQFKIFKILRENSYLKNPNLDELNKIEKAEDINAIKEGIQLIYNKLKINMKLHYY
jgi:hypothetical protein